MGKKNNNKRTLQARSATHGLGLASTLRMRQHPGSGCHGQPNKAETAVHGYHSLGDMALRMRKVLARPRVSVPWVPANLMPEITLRWIGIPSRGA